jgi:hypothetical protein
MHSVALSDVIADLIRLSLHGELEVAGAHSPRYEGTAPDDPVIRVTTPSATYGIYADGSIGEV